MSRQGLFSFAHVPSVQVLFESTKSRNSRLQRGERPSWSDGRTPEHQGCDPGWNRDTGLYLSLSTTGDRDICGAQKGCETVVLCPKEQVAPNLRVTGRIELEPPPAVAESADRFRSNRGSGAERLWKAMVGCGLRQDAFGFGPHQGGESYRRYSEGDVVVYVEEACGGIWLEHTFHVLGDEGDGFECLLIATHAAAIPRTTVDILPCEERDALPSPLAEAFNGRIAVLSLINI